ncbi:helix-turn-helix domain-containing protein [Candidatus Gottesmanbacteria bacterium]|nr:helix-turn-helix domain-containing protein [Candidatus Gottesmanbacteria bacterium]
MAAEAPQPQKEQPLKNPLQEARSAFNGELLGKEYHEGLLLTRTLMLQNALLKSELTPEKIYHELSVIAAQGADRAEIFNDPNTASVLRELQTGFQLTYQTFQPSLEVASRATKPTRTENLPPMTSAKGETGPQQPIRPQPKIPTTPSQLTEQQALQETGEIQKEETIGSFVRQKRTELKLSQAKLAQAVDVHWYSGIISLLERGLQLPKDPEKIARLAAALGLNEEETQKFMDLYNKQIGKKST